MAVNIEDAGFEIKDLIAWVHGSGFSKGRNLERDDPSFAGWHTMLKPAMEPITLAQKPIDQKTIGANLKEHGTGGLNIDECRVKTNEVIENHSRGKESAKSKGKYGDSKAQESHQTRGQQEGRFPANFIHDGSDEVLEQFPYTKSGLLKSGGKRKLEVEKNKNCYGVLGGTTTDQDTYADEGSAARFFYCAKASNKDRGADNNHKTVKPTDLMKYLVTLVTPQYGPVLDPFMGSGSTLKAASLLGFSSVGIEQEEEYCEIAAKRLDKIINSIEQQIF